MATIQELSKQCGVSVSTVSKALNGYTDISDRTRELVIKAANEMGYFPNANARALKLKKTYNIGVLFTTHTTLGLRNEYFAHILSAFREEVEAGGYDITFIEHYVGRRRMTYLEHCQYRHFDGVCIVCANYENEEVIELVDSDIPVVTVDYQFPRTYSILSDNYNGMRQLVTYIIHQGHSRIAFIHGLNTLVTRNRIKAYRDVLEENGIKVRKEYLLEGVYCNPMVSEEMTNKLLKLPNRPTCIIAPDDHSALGVITAARKQGLQLKDISVAGYDGLDNLLVGVRITSVKQERENIGKEAAKRLLRFIEKPGEQAPGTVYMRQVLIKGNSVRKLE